MPIASILAGFVDFVLAFILLLGMMLFYGYFPTINTFWLPFFILLAIMTAVGVGLWLGAMNVKYRDVRYMVSLYHTSMAVCHTGRIPKQPAHRDLADPLWT